MESAGNFILRCNYEG